MLARASEVTSVLIRGCALSIGTVDHTGLGYCLLNPAPRYPLLPSNTFAWQAVRVVSLTD